MDPERRPCVSRANGLMALALAVLLFGYLLAPGHPLTLLQGVPLNALGLGLVGGLAIVLYGFGRPRAGRWSAVAMVGVLMLVGLKVGLWWSAPTYGLAASYYSRARIGGAPERSIEHRGVDYTRVEAGPGSEPLGLHFFNDLERFNFYEDGQPDRRALPFAVRWEGFLQVPADGAYLFELTSSGSAALSLDGRPVLTVAGGRGQPADRATLALSAGRRSVQVDLVHMAGVSPSLGLGWDLGDGLVPLAAPFLTVEPAERAWLARDAVLSQVAHGLDVAFIVLLVGLCSWVATSRRGSWERPLLALFVGAVFAHALATTQHLYREPVILEGGQDWLTYESYARDILLNGPLMTLGKPLGEGRPFFFQPFYPYYLAGLHWLTGEDLWGPTVLQLLGLGVSAVLLYYLARRLFGWEAGLGTLTLFVILWATQLDWVARKLLSENLYFLLLPAAILTLLRYLDEGRWRDLVVAGVLFGLASITRAPTLLYVPLAAIVVAVVCRRRGASGRSAALAVLALLGLTAGVAAFVPVRNYVVAGRPSLVATNGGATLLLAHQPTPRVRLARVDQDPVYNLLNLDRPTREVVEFVRQDPVGYAATLAPLGLYALGFSGAVEGSADLQPELVGLTLLYLAALFVLPAGRSLRAALLHLFIVTHFVMMMTFLPYVYGYRQVLPMQLLMLVFAGALLSWLVAIRRWGSTPQLARQPSHSPQPQ